jgi:hypothetical protein
MELKVITYDHSVFTIFTREVTLLSLGNDYARVYNSYTELRRKKQSEYNPCILRIRVVLRDRQSHAWAPCFFSQRPFHWFQNTSKSDVTIRIYLSVQYRKTATTIFYIFLFQSFISIPLRHKDFTSDHCRVYHGLACDVYGGHRLAMVRASGNKCLESWRECVYLTKC